MDATVEWSILDGFGGVRGKIRDLSSKTEPWGLPFSSDCEGEKLTHPGHHLTGQYFCVPSAQRLGEKASQGPKSNDGNIGPSRNFPGNGLAHDG
jgi:hypothetical protein